MDDISRIAMTVSTLQREVESLDSLRESLTASEALRASVRDELQDLGVRVTLLENTLREPLRASEREYCSGCVGICDGCKKEG